MSREKRDMRRSIQRIAIEYAAKSKPARNHIREEQERRALRAKEKAPHGGRTPNEAAEK